MQRHHQLPFGTELQPGGGAVFRLWAPSAKQVELELAGGDKRLALVPQPGGWFELRADAGPGSRYRFRIDNDLAVPDPAARFQPLDDGVHGFSEVIDPTAFDWQDRQWRGRPWREAVVYELHIGAFSPSGDYDGVRERLDYLADLGVTAIELMPLAQFPGRRNWGYDGVLPFAPAACYGRPEALKALIQAAHQRNIMVLLDVVYNHFGPEGNYLHAYAKPFFNPDEHTPWGAAIDFGHTPVRQFFIHNALYWLNEFHFDGLRLDAVHAIRDRAEPDILSELAAMVHKGPGQDREVHLVLENDANQASYIGDELYTAQWNDDAHHAFHVLLTDEQDGYYNDYADRPIEHLGRCLTAGFAYQGEPSAHRDGERRGQDSTALSPLAMVNFMQNHDQIGNRALGERLTELSSAPARRAAATVLLLAPSPPLLFMGEEWGSRQAFPFFCDFGPELASAVTEGRRREFASFSEFGDPQQIPDPNAPETFALARLDWDRARSSEWLTFYRELLTLRQREIVPRLDGIAGFADCAELKLLGERALDARWRLGDGSRLRLLANLGPRPLPSPLTGDTELLYASEPTLSLASLKNGLPAWSALWCLQ